MDKETHKKLLKRHKELKSIGKVTEAVESSGLSTQTYARAINGDDKILHKTLMKILSAQQSTIDKAHNELLTA